MIGPRKPSNHMNGAYIKNALKSIASITTESVGDLAPNTRNVIKDNKESVADIAKSVKEDPSVKGQFKRIADKLTKAPEPVEEEKVEDNANTDYRKKVKDLNKPDDLVKDYNITHLKNNYIVKDMNFKIHSKAIYTTLASIGQSNQTSLCKLEDSINSIIGDLNNDLLFFGSTLDYVGGWSNTLAKATNNMKRYSDTRTGRTESDINADSVASYIRAEKMFDVGEVVKQFIKNRSVNGKKEGDAVGVWLANTFTNKTAMVLTFMTNQITPKNIRELGEDIKSTILNVNTIIKYTLKDMSESDNPMSVLIAGKLGFISDKGKSKVFPYKKTKVAFDGITRRAIVRVIPTYLSKILTAYDGDNYPDELTYDYKAGVFTNEKDVANKRKKYNKVLKDYKGVKNLKEFTKQSKSYNKFANRYSSSDKLDKDDYSVYENEKLERYRRKRYKKKNKGMQKTFGARLTGSLQNKLKQVDQWLFKLPADPKSVELLINRGLGIANNMITDDLMPNVPGIMRLVSRFLRYRIPEKAREVIGKIFHIELQPLSFYMEKAKDKIVKTFKLDYLKEVYSTAKAKVKDFIAGPVTDLIVNAKTSINSFITLSLMRFTRFINNQTQFIKDAMHNENVRPERESKVEKLSRRDKKKKEVATTFKRVNKALVNILNTFKSTITGPIRESHKIYGNNRIFTRIKNMDSNLCNILYYDKGLEPSMVPHIKYTLDFKDRIKRYVLRPLKNIMGYIRDVKKEMHITKNIIKVIKQIPKLLRTTLKAVDHAISVVQGIMKVMKPILEVATDTIQKGISKLADIHKSIMSHTGELVHAVFTESVPKIIEGIGDISVKVIRSAGSAAKFASTSFLKLAGTALYGGVNVIRGLIKGAGKVILTLDEFRKHLFIKNKATYETVVVGGNLDNIRNTVRYEEVKTMKDVFSDEDAEDRADTEKEKKKVSRIQKLTGERIKTSSAFVSGILMKALGFFTEMFSKVVTTFAATALGGTVGGLIGKGLDWFGSTKIGKKLSELRGKKTEATMKVYIVGGTVDGTIIGKSDGDDSSDLEDKVKDVIEDKVEDADDKKSTKKKDKKTTNKIKDTSKKLWKKAKKHKKGLAITGITAVTGIIAAKKYSDSKEDTDEEATSSIKQSYQNFTDKVKDANESKKVKEVEKNQKEEISSINFISNELSKPEKSNKLIDNAQNNINMLKQVPGRLKSAGNNSQTNDKEAFNLTSSANKNKVNNQMLEKTNLFDNEIATTHNTTDTVDKLVANKRSQVKVDDRNEKALYGKLTEDEKLERLSQQGVLGVIGEIDKPQSPAKINDNKSSFRGILEAWKYGVSRGGILAGAFYALGARSILGNKKLLMKLTGTDNDEDYKEVIEKFKNTEIGKNTDNSTAQPPSADVNDPDASNPGNNDNPGTNNTDGFIWPLPGYSHIGSPYGWRICPFHGKEFHTGIDINGSGVNGKPIVAARAGKVTSASMTSSYGNFTQIEHDNGYMTCYAHQSKILVKPGDTVSQGQEIGKVGSTGNSTGPHLHFEVRKSPFARSDTQDPTKFVKYGNSGDSNKKKDDKKTNAAKLSQAIATSALGIDMSKITGAVIPESEYAEYPDPHYDLKVNKQMIGSGASGRDEPDKIEDNKSTASTSNEGDTSTVSIPDYKPLADDISDSTDEENDTSKVNQASVSNVGGDLSSPVASLYALQQMADYNPVAELDTTSIKKVKNTSGLFSLDNDRNNEIKKRVYATLVALLEELNDETNRLKDSANIAIITEVKKQIQEVSNMEEMGYSEIMNINNSIMKIAAGY